LPKLIDVGVTPASDAVLPAVPLHSAASAAGEKLNPAEVAVADDGGALVAPPAAAPLLVRTAAPDPADPAEPPSAWAGVLHGTEVVVVVDEVAADFDLAVVAEEPEPDFAAVVVVAAAAVEVVVQGTVVALPAA
jgi:hypothetical protein